MTIYFLRSNDNILMTGLRNGDSVPLVYTTLKEARVRAQDKAQDCAVQIVHQNKGVVETIKPRYGVKYQNERFTFVSREFDVSAAWALIAKDRKTETVNVLKLYEDFLKDNDFDFFADSNYTERDEKGARRMIQTMSFFAISVNKDKALSDVVDFTVPVLVSPIIVDDDVKSYMVIDGWHRIYKAHKHGLTEMPAFVLTVKETLSITVPW